MVAVRDVEHPIRERGNPWRPILADRPYPRYAPLVRTRLRERRRPLYSAPQRCLSLLHRRLEQEDWAQVRLAGSEQLHPVRLRSSQRPLVRQHHALVPIGEPHDAEDTAMTAQLPLPDERLLYRVQTWLMVTSKNTRGTPAPQRGRRARVTAMPVGVGRRGLRQLQVDRVVGACGAERSRLRGA